MGNCASPKSNKVITDSIAKVPVSPKSQSNGLEPQGPVLSLPLSRQARPNIKIQTNKFEVSHEAQNARVSKREKTDSERQLLKKILHSQFIFSNLSPECLNSTISKMNFYAVDPKTEVITQGKPGDTFFIVASGRLEVSTDSIVTGTLTKGQAFGEIALIHDTPRPFSVISTTFCNLWGLTRDDFRSSNHSANDKKYQEIKSFISSIPLFDMLIPVQKEKLVELLIPQEFEDEEIIVTEGEPGDLLYIIQKGTVRCTVNGEFRRDLTKGDFFGEQALLYGTKRTATVIAVKSVVTLSLHREHINKVLGNQLQQVIYKNTLRISLEKSMAFRHLSKKQIEGVIQAMKISSYTKGQALIQKGSLIGNNFYVVVKGSLQYNGKIINFANCIGDIEMLKRPGGKYTDSCVCEADCDIAELSRTELEKVIGGNLKTVNEKNVILDVLKQVRLFRTLPLQKLESLIGILTTKEFLKGQFIFNQGDPGNDFFIINEGEVEIIKDGTLIRIQEKNDFFGERAILFKENRTASARAKDKVVLWVLHKEDFLRVIDTGMRDQLIKRINLQDDQFQLSQVKLLKKLGNGAFGNVFLALNKVTNTLYAIKCVSRELVNRYGIEENMKVERRVLLKVDHPFIVKLVKTLKDEVRIYYILEYIRGSGLFETLAILDTLRVDDYKFFVACIVMMLEHLHERNIVYRDLKPENLMIDEEGYLKLIDFGTAKALDGKTFTLVGTPQYMAPEIILGKGYGLSADLWSLGIITYELVTKRVPFGHEEKDPYKIYELILEGTVLYPASLKGNPRVKIFIDKLLNMNPSSRGTADAVKLDKMFSGFNWEGLLSKHLKPPYIPIINSIVLESANFEFGEMGINEIVSLEESKQLLGEENRKRKSKFFDPYWDEEF